MELVIRIDCTNCGLLSFILEREFFSSSSFRLLVVRVEADLRVAPIFAVDRLTDITSPLSKVGNDGSFSTTITFILLKSRIFQSSLAILQDKEVVMCFSIKRWILI